MPLPMQGINFTMTWYSPRGTASKGDTDGRMSLVKQEQLIKRGTEMFRQKLQDRFKQEQLKQDTTVSGGVPPHLLRNNGDVSCADSPPRASGTSVSSLTSPTSGDDSTRKSLYITDFKTISKARITDPRGPPKPLNTALNALQPEIRRSRTLTSQNTEEVPSRQGAASKVLEPKVFVPEKGNGGHSKHGLGRSKMPSEADSVETIRRIAPVKVHATNYKAQKDVKPVPREYHEYDANEDYTWLQGNEVQRRFKQPKWRPARSVTSQSLPDTVSSINSEDDDLGAQFVHKDGGCTNMQLVLAPKPEDDDAVDTSSWDDDTTWGQNWHTNFIDVWVDATAKSKIPKARFLKKRMEGHETRDVDTYTGTLCKPIDYPETTIDPADLRNLTEELPRRLIDTSESKSKPVLENYKRRIKNLRVKSSREGVHPLLWGNITNETVFEEPEVDPDPLPGRAKILCFMRPARKSDLTEILEIYNWEVLHGIQALDNKPLLLQDFESILEQCKKAKTPFIVVIGGKSSQGVAREYEDLVRQRSKPSRAWQHVNQHGLDRKTLQQVEQQRDPTNGPVLAFGFITIPGKGLAGDVHENVDRFHGRLHLYVDHQYRRKGIGQLLLQRLSACCSVRAETISALHMGWFDRDEVRACQPAWLGARQYWGVFIEFASRGKEDADTQWMSNFLMDEEYEHSHTLTNARKVGLGESGKWMDTEVWQLPCRTLFTNINTEGPPKNPWA
ncbi:hypothetical protein BD289DRAFT_457257 [Coniella lustricola]|uniref:N-acetyltransferase domain-containing protein n=1 Tax=Coniella lustricola TaxID=2025994 RepID=A0A2T2ZSK0_9PEZI|nr:hypothetical protein BD289DRAFT_457257 [Coniella lustricola]